MYNKLDIYQEMKNNYTSPYIVRIDLDMTSRTLCVTDSQNTVDTNENGEEGNGNQFNDDGTVNPQSVAQPRNTIFNQELRW